MDKIQIEEIIISCLKEYLESQDIECNVDNNTSLIGQGAVIDSIGLVNVILDVESKMSDEDFDISITSEKAMSRKNSPFRTVDTLTEYVLENIGDENE